MGRKKGNRGRDGIERNLAKVYPISGLTDFRRTFWLLIATVTLSVVAAIANILPTPFISDQEVNVLLNGSLRALAFGLACWWFGRFVYECLRRHCVYYGLDDGQFVISRGIILKQRGFFPLSRITDIYLERSPLDFVFGLHTLHISTPTSLSERFARIEGLNLETALALQQLLSSVVEPSAERSHSRSALNEREQEDYM